MDTILQKVIEMSLYGSIAILLVILFRMVFRKYSKKLTLLFWVIVAFRLICPINFSSPLSVMNLVTSKSESVQVETEVRRKEVQVKSKKIQGDVKAVQNNVSKVEETKIEKASPKLDREEIMFFAWVGGIAVLLIFAATRYVRVNRFANRCRQTSDGRFLESDSIETPFVAGVIKTRICIPSHIENSEKEYLLLHEQMHIKNSDGLIKVFGFMLVCLHWFNPLVWLAYVLFCSDLEMRCDEEVIEALGKSVKKDYCRSLVLHSVKEPLGLPGSVAFSGLGLGALEVKMRIKNLLNYKKVSKGASVIILCLTFGITGILTACATEKKDTKAALKSIKETEDTEETVEETEEETEFSEESEDISVEESEDETIPSAIVIGDTEIEDYDYPEPEFFIDTSYDYSVDENLSKYAEEAINDGYEYCGMVSTECYLSQDESRIYSILLFKNSDNKAVLITNQEYASIPLEAYSILWNSSIDFEEYDTYYTPTDDGGDLEISRFVNENETVTFAEGTYSYEDSVIRVKCFDASKLPV